MINTGKNDIDVIVCTKIKTLPKIITRWLCRMKADVSLLPFPYFDFVMCGKASAFVWRMMRGSVASARIRRLVREKAIDAYSEASSAKRSVGRNDFHISVTSENIGASIDSIGQCRAEYRLSRPLVREAVVPGSR